MNSKMTTVHDIIKRKFNASQYLRVTAGGDIPLSYISAFFYIGLHADGSVAKTHLESVLEVSQSTMSRILQRLGDGSAENDKVKGLGLIVTTEDSMDWRIKRVTLTKKGKEVLSRYARIVNPEVMA